MPRPLVLAAVVLLAACRYDPVGPPPTSPAPARDSDAGDATANEASPSLAADAGQDAPAETAQPETAPGGDPDASIDTNEPTPPVDGPPPDQILCGPQTMCVPGDGCCPAACNSTNDGDCAPKCGNGVVERGETCDPVATCTARQTACRGDHGRVRTGTGNPSACTFACQESARTCGPADGFCPTNCVSDPDCAGPGTCVKIQFCTKPTAPNQGKVVCLTNENPACTANQKIGECTRDAREVCGNNHARPIEYAPPIAGMSTG